MKVYLNYKTSTHVSRDDTDQPYGGSDSSTAYSGITLSTSPDGSGYYHDSLEIPDDFSEGTLYYAYAVYSTGDSFSRSEDGCIELLFACRSKDDAHKAATILSKEKENYSVTVSLDGRRVEVRAPWSGYFETLSYINVESIDFSDTSYARTYRP